MWMVSPGAIPWRSATSSTATCFAGPGVLCAGGCAAAGIAIISARNRPARNRIFASNAPSTAGYMARLEPARKARLDLGARPPPSSSSSLFRVLRLRVPASFDDIAIGQVVTLGAAAVDPDALTAFVAAFTPGWTADRGAPDAMVYAIWAKLDAVAHTDWPQTKRLGVDALRWVRNPPAGELLRGRMTIMAKDPVGEGKGIVIAQHDLLDEAGRLVFSCLTRSVFAR